MVDFMESRDKKFHFIAIGGVGMSALAKYLVECGASVTGSDIQESKSSHCSDVRFVTSSDYRKNLLGHIFIIKCK